MENFSETNSSQEAKGYLVFSDEAGGYSYGILSDKYINNNPAYIRSYILISISDYKKFQSIAKDINVKFNIPVGNEIKWSDLGSLSKHNSKKQFVNKLKVVGVQSYIRKTITSALKLKSLRIYYTITFNSNEFVNFKITDFYKRHLEYAIQRVNKDINNGFAMLIIDEFKGKESREIKNNYYFLTHNGDFYSKFKNIYHGLFMENSAYSPGIQLADYFAGIFNCFIKNNSHPNNFQFAIEFFETYIIPKIKRNNTQITGYGVIPVHKYDKVFRDKLINLLDNKYKKIIDKLK